MTMKLYHHPISTCSQKVRLAMAEKGLTFEGVTIDWGKQDHLSNWYLKINPNGVVPALVHDGRSIVDSSVICEYLEEAFPDRHRLAPADAYGRAAMRAWMRYLEEVPTVAIRVPSFTQVFARSLKSGTDEAFQAMTEKMPLRKHFYRKMGPKGFSETEVAESMDRLASCLDRVERTLADGRPYLLGEDYTIADILLVPTMVRLEDLGHARLWDDRKKVADWYARIQARPSFDVAYMPGARIDPDKFTLPMAKPEEIVENAR